jgi:hypothetical protein
MFELIAFGSTPANDTPAGVTTIENFVEAVE